MSETTMTIADFIHRYRAPWGLGFDSGTPVETWVHACECLADEPAEQARVADLIADLHERGQREPVRVTDGGCDPQDPDCTGEPDCCPAQLLDGVHRVLAHLNEGWENLRVACDEAPGQDRRGTETIVTFAPGQAITDDAFDAVMSLMSFRHTPVQWASADGMSSNSNTFAIHWGTPIIDNLPGLVATVKHRLRQAGMPEPVTIEHVLYEDFDTDEDGQIICFWNA